MRHIGRARGVSISFLHQVYRRIDVSINYISSTLMAADIYTKTFPERTKWEHLCKQINVVDRKDLQSKDLFTLHAMVLESSIAKYRRVQKPGDLLPAELEKLSGAPGLGWHTLDDNELHGLPGTQNHARVL